MKARMSGSARRAAANRAQAVVNRTARDGVIAARARSAAEWDRNAKADDLRGKLAAIRLGNMRNGR